MKNMMIARRYARALFELAQEKKALDDVLQGMSNLRVALTKSEDFERVLGNPLVNADQKTKLISSVTSNKLILKFISLLDKRKRLGLLLTVEEQLVALADEKHGVRRALVRTATPLTDEQRRAIEHDLAKNTGGKILGRFEVAKELIGGIWVRMGDKVLDATLKGRVEDLRHALVHSNN